jgi:hypothetical protein
MFNIGDFARFDGVSVRTLRYYAELDLLRPAEVDTHTAALAAAMSAPLVGPHGSPRFAQATTPTCAAFLRHCGIRL